VYKGKAAYCRLQNHYDESRLEQGFRSHLFHLPKPESEWIYVDAPALVDVETWDICQKRLTENKTRLSGSTERKHMLSGLLRCPVCGRNLIGHRQTRIEPRQRKETSVRHIHYYHCPEGRSLKIVGAHSCSRKQYKAAVVEGLAERAIEQLAHTSDFMRCALEEHRLRNSGGYSEKEYEQIAAQVRALDGKEDATVRAQVAGIESGANPAIYGSLLKEIGEKRTQLQAQLAQMEELQAKAASIRPEEEADVIQAAMRDVSEALRAPELTPGEKHTLVAQVIKDIVPQEEGFKMTLRVPFNSAATVPYMSALWPSGC
ncbi:MAG: recombinase family protein, partial [Armatimonadota bacterium]|nr:recombinase family protein [Armatimonadota bacterium]